MQLFVWSAGGIFALVGISKIWSVVTGGKLLSTTDPIVGIKIAQLLVVVAVLEIATALICFSIKPGTTVLGLIAWLSSSFLVYRIGLWWVEWQRPCGCLGNLTDALHISPQVADNIMKVVLAYLLIGSYGLLFWQWRLNHRGRNGIVAGNNETIAARR